MYFLNIVSRTWAEMIINGLGNTNQRKREFFLMMSRFTYFSNSFSFNFYLFLAMAKNK